MEYKLTANEQQFADRIFNLIETNINYQWVKDALKDCINSLNKSVYYSGYFKGYQEGMDFQLKCEREAKELMEKQIQK